MHVCARSSALYSSASVFRMSLAVRACASICIRVCVTTDRHRGACSGVMLIILMTTVTSVVFKILGSPECSTPHDNVWGQGRKKQLVKTYFTITARHLAFGAETEALCSSQRSLTAFWRGWGLALGKCFSLAKLHRETTSWKERGLGTWRRC